MSFEIDEDSSIFLSVFESIELQDVSSTSKPDNSSMRKVFFFIEYPPIYLINETSQPTKRLHLPVLGYKNDSTIYDVGERKSPSPWNRRKGWNFTFVIFYKYL